MLLASIVGGAFFPTSSRSQTMSASPSGDSPISRSQIASGKAAYNAHCASCHGPNLNDGSAPPLKEAGFGANWLNKPSSALAAFTRSSMPPNNPGGLSPETYGDIAAYIFSANIAASDQSTQSSAQNQAGAQKRAGQVLSQGPTAEEEAPAQWARWFFRCVRPDC